MVERGGSIRRRVVANVTGKTLKAAIKECVDPAARIMTDELSSYGGLARHFAGHEVVAHSSGEYARDDAHTNTAESSFAIVKRGLMGIYHAVSKKHLHRYIAEYDFRWNARRLNDGERTALAIQAGVGKRLMYREPAQQS